MDTLLNKVRKIEEEARARVEQIEKTGRDSMSDLVAAETEVIDKVRVSAEGRAQAIIEERVETAKREINALRQDEQKSAQTIHDKAKENRSRVVELATKLFEADFV